MTSVLCLGDVVGKSGRRAVKEILPRLREQLMPDYIVINCENAAGGFGVNRKIVNELFSAGADVLTGGNHIWDKLEVLDVLESTTQLALPINFRTAADIELNKSLSFKKMAADPRFLSLLEHYPRVVRCQKKGCRPLVVVSVMGAVFMERKVTCLFPEVRAYIETLRQDDNLVFVDFHAEATSEKQAMGYYLDGIAHAVVGSHTHVQTSDECILPKGSAYMTDMGMSGAHHSILGMRVEDVLLRFVDDKKQRLQVAKEDVGVRGVFIRYDEHGSVQGLQRISEQIVKKSDLIG